MCHYQIEKNKKCNHIVLDLQRHIINSHKLHPGSQHFEELVELADSSCPMERNLGFKYTSFVKDSTESNSLKGTRNYINSAIYTNTSRSNVYNIPEGIDASLLNSSCQSSTTIQSGNNLSCPISCNSLIQEPDNHLAKASIVNDISLSSTSLLPNNTITPSLRLVLSFCQLFTNYVFCMILELDVV